MGRSSSTRRQAPLTRSACRHGLPLRAVTEQPLFYLSMLLVILGVQFFLAGFLGELIDRNASDRNKYLIDKNI